MMTSAPTAPDAEVFRPLSIHAVISGVLGGISLLAWTAPTLVAVAIVAALCGVTSAMRLRGRSAEVAGLRIAIGGCSISLLCLSGASLWHWHRYAIESPAGFERVDLSDIFDAQIEDVTPAMLQLRGRHISVKAYMDPFWSSERATSFTISRMESTGFGARARPGEQLVVELAEGLLCEYGQSPIVVCGVFDIERDFTAVGPRFRLFLRNATMRPATSPIGLPIRNPRTC